MLACALSFNAIMILSGLQAVEIIDKVPACLIFFKIGQWNATKSELSFSFISFILSRIINNNLE